MVAAGEASHRACRLRARAIASRSLCKLGRWLVLVPHADDEALGCGGLLRILTVARARPLVVYLTDGAASHLGSPTWPPSRLAAARRLEALASLRLLGVPRSDVFWLDWPDAKPHDPSSLAFRASSERLRRLCRSAGIRAMATPWRGEPHCDHAAAHDLARAACGHSIKLYEYLVWGWTLSDLTQQLAGRDLLRIAAGETRVQRKRALACHRTQHSGLISDAAEAFRLMPHMAALTERTTDILITQPRGHETHAIH
jgi:LmbE family N-acetylglucosaminyl deacetylase